MMKFAFALACLLSLIATFTPAAHALEVHKKNIWKDGISATISDKLTKDFVTSGEKVFREKKEVAVGIFKVGFIYYNYTSAMSRGTLTSAGRASSSVEAELVGVPDEVMQNITNEAYKTFIAALESQGYTVVNAEKITAHPTFQKLKPDEAPYRTRKPGLKFYGDNRDAVVYFAPEGMNLYLMPDDHGMPANKNTFGYNTFYTVVPKVAKETGIPVINANFVIGFANGESNKSAFGASSKISPGISLYPGSYISLTDPDNGNFKVGEGSIRIQKPVFVPGAFTQSMQESSTTAQKASEVITNVIGVFSGRSTSTGRYKISADPQKYEENVKQAVGFASETFSEKMAALR